MDIAAALPIATSTPMTNLCQYINSNLGYNDLKIQLLCSKIATINRFEVAILNGVCLCVLNFTVFSQMSFENSNRAAYSDLNPSSDGGQSLYPMSTMVMYQIVPSEYMDYGHYLPIDILWVVVSNGVVSTTLQSQAFFRNIQNG